MLRIRQKESNQEPVTAKNPLDDTLDSLALPLLDELGATEIVLYSNGAASAGPQAVALALGVRLELTKLLDALQNVLIVFLAAGILADFDPSSLDQLVGELTAILQFGGTELSARVGYGVLDCALDRFAYGQFPEVFAGLEGKGLVSLSFQVWSGHVCQREGPFGRRVVGAGQDECVTAQHAFDVADEYLGHDGLGGGEKSCLGIQVKQVSPANLDKTDADIGTAGKSCDNSIPRCHHNHTKTCGKTALLDRWAMDDEGGEKNIGRKAGSCGLGRSHKT